jgi:hypothetical protein
VYIPYTTSDFDSSGDEPSGCPVTAVMIFVLYTSKISDRHVFIAFESCGLYTIYHLLEPFVLYVYSKPS